MSKFFSRFPKIKYDISQGPRPVHTTITNIFFRINIIKKILEKTTSYYEYSIEEFDRPDTLAHKLYGNSEYHWILLYANDMYDPVSDWPKDYNTFHKYIENKYGSIENAKLTDHHYEMIITRENVTEEYTDETRYIVTKEKLTDNNLTVPFDYYQGTGSLEDTQGVEQFDIGGKTVIVTTQRETISNYDYEKKLNDERRIIKVIKKSYIPQILNEYVQLTTDRKTDNLRRFV